MGKLLFRTYRKWILLAAILTILFIWIFRNNPEWAEQIFGQNLYPIWHKILNPVQAKISFPLIWPVFTLSLGYLLIPLFFKGNSEETMEKNGCNIINVNGVAFSHFLKIIKSGFFIKGLVLTDQDTGKKTEERATDLKKDYEEDGLIRVEISEGSTFEKDVITANKDGKGKEILLNVLKETKPKRGVEYADELGESDIDTESFFLEIENYKSEFAFNLASHLKEKPNMEVFTVPQYIQDGFDFLK